MKTTNETRVNELKNQMMANFESMTFDEAMAANADLFKEYEEIKGRRSLAAFVSYCRNRVNASVYGITIKNEANLLSAEPEIVNEPEETPEVQEPEQETTEPVVESEPEEPFIFNLSGIGCFSKDSIQSLIDSENPTVMQFCIIREYFKIESDGEIVRKTNMYVKNDGTGFAKWNDARATANANGMKSMYKHGNFDLSADGFPVGEECATISVMRIRDAFQKFVIDRYGAKTQVVVAECFETDVIA